jgi:hypothetical protein
VEVFEFDRAAGVAEFLEHAASADGLELARVTDEGESPLALLGVHDELVKVTVFNMPASSTITVVPGPQSNDDRSGLRWLSS